MCQNLLCAIQFPGAAGVDLAVPLSVKIINICEHLFFDYVVKTWLRSQSWPVQTESNQDFQIYFQNILVRKLLV